jgi:hypothetical protein
MRPGFYYAVSAVPLMAAGILGAELLNWSYDRKLAAFIACVIVSFVLIAIGAVKELRAESHNLQKSGHARRIVAIVALSTCGAALVALAAAYFWPSSFTLFVECHEMRAPTAIPKEGVLYTVNPVLGGSGGMGESGGLYLGDRIPSGTPIIPAYRCSLTNYGIGPMIDVQIDLGVQFTETEKAGKKMLGPTPMKADKAWPFSVRRIDVGEQNRFVLYINNYNTTYLGVLFPREATFAPLSSNTRRSAPIRLSSGDSTLMALPPFLGSKSR